MGRCIFLTGFNIIFSAAIFFICLRIIILGNGEDLIFLVLGIVMINLAYQLIELGEQSR